MTLFINGAERKSKKRRRLIEVLAQEGIRLEDELAIELNGELLSAEEFKQGRYLV